MFVLVFILPLIAALLGLVLNRTVPTRWLGVGASAALLVCGAALLIARARAGLPLALLEHNWMALESRTVAVSLQFDGASWALALLVLAGGGLALLALALALPPNLRGFGGLFAASDLALLVVTIGLADQSVQFLPFLWATAAMLIFLALRASGALAGSDAPVIVLLTGLWGALVLLGAALMALVALPGTPVAQMTLAFWVLVGLLALGAPPFHAPFQELSEAPAALAGALLPLGLPLLGGYALIRFFARLDAPLAPGWRLALTLLGLLTLLACAAGAAGTSRLRRLIGWQFSAQMGLLLVALGQGGAALTAAAPALLANGALATLACFLATAALERRAGTDDLADIALGAPLALPGTVFLIGVASAVGLPGTWGFWPRRWLIDELLGANPGAVAPLLAASALLALTFVAPLAAFWRGGTSTAGAQAAPRGQPVGPAIVSGVAAAVLVILGVVPGIAWNSWLAPAQAVLAGGQPVIAPRLPGISTQIVCAGVALGLLALSTLAQRGRSGSASAEGAVASRGVLAPQALGESLRGAAWLAAPNGAFAGLWSGLLWVSQIIRRGLSLFEQRYYLAGLVIAVIVVIMLFIQ
jgi:formate hydrogenlyase subunit 3/multisubunit Na+/H+ antiporter MnhD subunit